MLLGGLDCCIFRAGTDSSTGCLFSVVAYRENRLIRRVNALR